MFTILDEFREGFRLDPYSQPLMNLYPLGLRFGVVRRCQANDSASQLTGSVFRVFVTAALSVLFGFQTLSAQVSQAESPEFVLDLRPPESNPDAVSVGESASFALDLAMGLSVGESAAFILDLRPPKDPGFAAWLNLHFSAEELLMPAVTDEVANPDFDGQDNWFEYIARLDPRDPTSYFKIYYTNREFDAVRFGPISEGVTYDFQYSKGLETWNSVESSQLSTVEDEIEVDVSGLPRELFHRVKLSKPEPSE